MTLLAIAIGVAVFCALLHFAPDPNRHLPDNHKKDGPK